MARIPKFDEKTARKLYETLPGTPDEKAAGLAKFYGFGDVYGTICSLRMAGSNAVPAYLGNIHFDKVINFEPRSPMHGNKKQLFTYDQSLERIKAAGYERHARPSEVFSFLIDGLEGKLTESQKVVYDDMLSNDGEWLSMAWQRKYDKIICYSDPENLKWDGIKYIIEGNRLIYGDENEFPCIKGDTSVWRLIGLDKFDNGLIQFLYGRRFAQLPREMRIGNNKTGLFLPRENTISALGRGIFNFYFNVDGNNWYAASRGIRTTQIPYRKQR